jgi:hypothetical protein
VAKAGQEGAALRALQAILPGGLRAGEVGALVSPAGIGKTQLLIYTALERLLAGDVVLHIAIREPVLAVRDAYDSMLSSMFGSPGQVRAEAMHGVERRRMIHSTRGGAVDVARLLSLLETLGEVVEFHPRLVVIDGQAPAEDSLPALRKLALERNLALWFAWTPQADEEPAADVVLALSFRAGDLWLNSLRGPAHEPVRVPRGSLASPEPLGSLEMEGAEAGAVLYSGGASGTEAAFGAAAERHGVREVNFTFTGHAQVRTRGAHPLTEAELAEGDVSLAYVSRRLRRSYSGSAVIRRVLQSLWHQVRSAQVVLVVGTIQEDGTVTGGTGWSVELARMWNKRLWVYDQEKEGWYRWTNDEWLPGTPVLGNEPFCGTGTRYLSDLGRAAVDDLFERSFPE